MKRSHQEHAIDSYLAVLRALDTVRLSYWEGCNLTVLQLRLMHLISEFLTPSVGDLAAATNVRPSTVTGLADRLVKRRLIERFLDSADRRVVRLRLSAEGARVLDGVSPNGRACLAAAFAALDYAQRAALLDSFDRFAAAVRGVPCAEQERHTGMARGDCLPPTTSNA